MNAWDSFWPSFLSNLAADSVIAVVFGLFLAYLLSKRLNQLERIEQRKDEARTGILEQINHWGLFENEIECMQARVPEIQEQLMHKDWGELKHIETGAWEAVHQNTAVLAQMDSELISQLGDFYYEVSKVQKLINDINLAVSVQTTTASLRNDSGISLLSERCAEGLDYISLNTHDCLKKIRKQYTELNQELREVNAGRRYFG